MHHGSRDDVHIVFTATVEKSIPQNNLNTFKHILHISKLRVYQNKKQLSKSNVILSKAKKQRSTKSISYTTASVFEILHYVPLDDKMKANSCFDTPS